MSTLSQRPTLTVGLVLSDDGAPYLERASAYSKRHPYRHVSCPHTVKNGVKRTHLDPLNNLLLCLLT